MLRRACQQPSLMSSTGALWTEIDPVVVGVC